MHDKSRRLHITNPTLSKEESKTNPILGDNVKDSIVVSTLIEFSTMSPTALHTKLSHHHFVTTDHYTFMGDWVGGE